MIAEVSPRSPDDSNEAFGSRPRSQGYAPLTACIFCLKNRRPKQWRDVQKHEHTMTRYDDLSQAEIVRQIRDEAQLLLEHHEREAREGGEADSNGD